jgi:membrane protein implicated in regulation of membrane protease activity
MASVLAAFILKVFVVQFALALPWSMGIALISPLLMHMGKEYLDIGFLAGSVLNTIVLVRYLLKRKMEEDIDR